MFLGLIALTSGAGCRNYANRQPVARAASPVDAQPHEIQAALQNHLLGN